MKKFSFSLQRLLDYKEQVLDAERATLADMNMVLNGFIRELEAMKADLERRAREYDESNAKGTTPMDMLIQTNYIRKLEDDIFQKEVQIEMQRKVVDKQTDKVREAKMEISTMEKLKEHRLEEYNYLDNKEQELFIEEFISNARAVASQ